jgi:hypothetical protein
MEQLNVQSEQRVKDLADFESLEIKSAEVVKQLIDSWVVSSVISINESDYIIHGQSVHLLHILNDHLSKYLIMLNQNWYIHVNSSFMTDLSEPDNFIALAWYMNFMDLQNLNKSQRKEMTTYLISLFLEIEKQKKILSSLDNHFSQNSNAARIYNSRKKQVMDIFNKTLSILYLQSLFLTLTLTSNHQLQLALVKKFQLFRPNLKFLELQYFKYFSDMVGYEDHLEESYDSEIQTRASSYLVQIIQKYSSQTSSEVTSNELLDLVKFFRQDVSVRTLKFKTELNK